MEWKRKCERGSNSLPTTISHTSPSNPAPSFQDQRAEEADASSGWVGIVFDKLPWFREVLGHSWWQVVLLELWLCMLVSVSDSSQLAGFPSFADLWQNCFVTARMNMSGCVKSLWCSFLGKSRPCTGLCKRLIYILCRSAHCLGNSVALAICPALVQLHFGAAFTSPWLVFASSMLPNLYF